MFKNAVDRLKLYVRKAIDVHPLKTCLIFYCSLLACVLYIKQEYVDNDSPSGGAATMTQELGAYTEVPVVDPDNVIPTTSTVD